MVARFLPVLTVAAHRLVMPVWNVLCAPFATRIGLKTGDVAIIACFVIRIGLVSNNIDLVAAGRPSPGDRGGANGRRPISSVRRIGFAELLRRLLLSHRKPAVLTRMQGHV